MQFAVQIGWANCIFLTMQIPTICISLTNANCQGNATLLGNAFPMQMTLLRVEIDLVQLPELSNSGQREKMSSDQNWSFLSEFKVKAMRPNTIWFGLVHGLVN